MTEAERIARAHRAESALREFFEPIIGELRETYSARIVEVATTELARDKRSDKITALSTALKIVDAVESGMRSAIRDGELAKADQLKNKKIEQMTAPQRRMLSMAPRY